MWEPKYWDKKGLSHQEACPSAGLGCAHVPVHGGGEAVTERCSTRSMNDFPLEIPMCISGV